MNYRHIYHAGNFADVFKHVVMLLAVRHLQQKDKGLMLLDAFAGIGLYDLSREEAQKTEEYKGGIEAFMAGNVSNADLRDYRDLIAPFWAQRRYPGSPLCLASLRRAQDRVVANELHPKDGATLRSSLAGYEQTRVTTLDAYECIRAHIPPAERRGLVLIDPPFEKKDEFDLLTQQMQEWKKRWATGCYMIWYPIKAGPAVSALHNAAYDLGLNRTWVSEILLHPRQQEGTFNGCGLLVMNTPFQLPERVRALSGELSALLGGRISDQYLRND